MNAIHLKAPVALKPATAGCLPTRFEGVAYSGGMVPSLGVVIDLASTTVADRLPLLHEHVRSAIIGAVISATNDRRQLSVEGELFSDMAGSQAEQIAQLAQRGAGFQMSVGLYNFTEQTVRLGEQLTVNGRTVVGPLTVLRSGVVREVSIVTLGADHNTSARLFGHGAKQALSLSPNAIFAARARQAAGFKA